MCICSPGLVELVKSNLAPDFPLYYSMVSPLNHELQSEEEVVTGSVVLVVRSMRSVSWSRILLPRACRDRDITQYIILRGAGAGQ